MTPQAFLFCLSVAVATSAGDSSIEKRAVAQNQAQCVTLLTNHLTNDDVSCSNVAAAITPILAEEDIVNALDRLSDSVFAEFCRPSCGRRVLTAWETCSITQSYQREVNLVTSLCGHSRSMSCYENVQTLFGFIQSVEACQSDTEGQCSEQCRNLIDDSNGAFGCCVNIPIDFPSLLLLPLFFFVCMEPNILCIIGERERANIVVRTARIFYDRTSSNCACYALLFIQKDFKISHAA